MNTVHLVSYTVTVFIETRLFATGQTVAVVLVFSIDIGVSCLCIADCNLHQLSVVTNLATRGMFVKSLLYNDSNQNYLLASLRCEPCGGCASVSIR